MLSRATYDDSRAYFAKIRRNDTPPVNVFYLLASTLRSRLFVGARTLVCGVRFVGTRTELFMRGDDVVEWALPLCAAARSEMRVDLDALLSNDDGPPRRMLLVRLTAALGHDVVVHSCEPMRFRVRGVPSALAHVFPSNLCATSLFRYIGYYIALDASPRLVLTVTHEPRPGASLLTLAYGHASPLHLYVHPSTVMHRDALVLVGVITEADDVARIHETIRRTCPFALECTRTVGALTRMTFARKHES